MSVGYKPILWNRQKKRYDLLMLGLIVLYLLLFGVVTFIYNPFVRPETIIIRGTGSLAFIMLHVILCIGPLAQLNERFTPLLYNRRHLGVTMFLIAAVHAVFSTIQFHALGDVHPIVSIFSNSVYYDIPGIFPFQPLGFIAFLILFLMASTSHDFWLHNLSPRIWKSLHMLVYLAYVLLLGHVALGILQYENFAVRHIAVITGAVAVISLHVAAGRREVVSRLLPEYVADDGFVAACAVEDIEENRAKIVVRDGQEIAIFKYDGNISAVHNLCKHQNGPLGRGEVVDGCITCPWHGYQYKPGDGCSPPPFTEKVATYQCAVRKGIVYVNPVPFPEGTPVKPAKA